MASAPVYAVTPVIWSGLVPATNDISWTSPSHVTTLGSASTLGTKVDEIDVIPAGTVVAGLVNLFAYDGTNYHLLPNGSVQINAYSASATAPPPTTTVTYDNLVLPSGWSLVCTTTVAGNESLINVIAFGASF